jgi:hypothetical protein
MGGHVLQLAGPVAGRRDDFAGLHNDRADRDFAARAGRLRLQKRPLHEARAGSRHLASPKPL